MKLGGGECAEKRLAMIIYTRSVEWVDRKLVVNDKAVVWWCAGHGRVSMCIKAHSRLCREILMVWRSESLRNDLLAKEYEGSVPLSDHVRRKFYGDSGGRSRFCYGNGMLQLQLQRVHVCAANNGRHLICQLSVVKWRMRLMTRDCPGVLFHLVDWCSVYIPSWRKRCRGEDCLHASFEQW